MKTLNVTDQQAAILQQTTEPVELRDQEGNVIGYFAPVSPERAHLYDVPPRTGTVSKTKQEGSTPNEA